MEIDPLTLISMRIGGDKFGSHVYTPVYHSLFNHLRHLPIRMLEIGIGGYNDPRAGGSSLLTWAEYFKNATIVGLDISEKQLEVPDRVKIVKGSQNDIRILEKIVGEHGPFDIIIDDASHHVGLTQQTFMILYPTMGKSGIYIVEDTQTSFSRELAGQSDGRKTMFDVAHAISLGMHRAEAYECDPSFCPFEPSACEMFPDYNSYIQNFSEITHSVSVYRNLIVFQRGDNAYPSNAHLDFSHPGVALNYQIMEIAAAISPSSRDCLARIDMNIWAKRFDEAAQLALTAADRYPADRALLHQLRFQMQVANRSVEVQILEKLIAHCDRNSAYQD